MATEERRTRAPHHERRRTDGQGRRGFRAEDLARRTGRIRARQVGGPEDVRDPGRAGPHPRRQGARSGRRRDAERARRRGRRGRALRQARAGGRGPRVSKSLGRLGVLTRGEVGDLSKQVRDLTEDVRELMTARRQVRGRACRLGEAPHGIQGRRRQAQGEAGRVRGEAKRRAAHAHEDEGLRSTLTRAACGARVGPRRLRIA